MLVGKCLLTLELGFLIRGIADQAACHGTNQSTDGCARSGLAIVVSDQSTCDRTGDTTHGDAALSVTLRIGTQAAEATKGQNQETATIVNHRRDTPSVGAVTRRRGYLATERETDSIHLS